MIKLIEKYENKQIVVSTYHFQINDMIEKKHKFLINAFCKMLAKNNEN